MVLTSSNHTMHPPPKTQASEGDRKVFVQGLPWAATEEEVRDFFKGCGEMESVRSLPVHTVYMM